MTSESKTGNFTFLDNLIRSGAKEIVLDSDIILDDCEKDRYQKGIKIDVDGLVIDGNGFGLDANGNARIFDIHAENIIIKNATLKNAFSNDGAAIYNNESSSLKVVNCEFEDNLVDEDGGAVFNKGKLEVRDSVFLKNSTKHLGGGAIANGFDSSLDVINCMFEQNSANSGGGAILNWGKVNSIGTEFLDNVSRDFDGGAISNQKEGTCRAVDCVFDGNAAENGGAVVNFGKFNVEDSTFSSNSAKEGGAACNKQNAFFECVSCEFENNSSETNGGAVINFADISIGDCSFSGNSTKKEGGVIMNHSLTSCEIADSKFKDNSANESGGAISNSSFGFCIIGGCEFDANTADVDGGAIINYGNINLRSTGFFDNHAKYGGVFSNQRNAVCEFEGCRFRDNWANDSGGCFINFGNVNVKNTNFSNNVSKERGGGVIDNQSSGFCEFALCEFNNNSSNGGGVLVNFGGVNFKDSKFSNNSAKNNAGVIDNVLGSKLYCFDCEFTENACSVEGGCIFNESDNVKFINCIFSNHSNGKNLIFNKNDLILMNCTIMENSLEHIVVSEEKSRFDLSGGKITYNKVVKSVILNKSESFAISSIVIKDNESVKVEEGIDVVNDGKLNLQAPKFDRENAILNRSHIDVRKLPQDEVAKIIKNIDGATVDEFTIPDTEKFDFSYLDNLIRKSDKLIDLKEDISLENYELDFFEGGIDIDRDGIVVNGNNHVIDGRNKTRIFNIHAKDVTFRNMIFKNGQLFNNFEEHAGGGGAIRIIRNADVTFENCQFIDNSSQDDGGAILNNGTLHLKDNRFIANASKCNGGAVENNGILHTADDVYMDNRSKIAGAIYNKDKLVIQSAISVQDNVSDLKQDIYNANDISSQDVGGDVGEFIYNTHNINREIAYKREGFGYLKDLFEGSDEIGLKNNIQLIYEKADGHVVNIGDGMVFDGNNNIVDFNHFDISFMISGEAIFKNIIFKNAYVRDNPLFDVTGNITFENVIFLNNRMSSGNHLIQNHNSVRIIDSSFYNNVGINRALIANNSHLEVIGSNFTNNSTRSPGAIIYNKMNNSEKVTISLCCFLCNSTRRDGGVIYNLNGSSFEIDETKFIKNNAYLAGGVIFNKGDMTLRDSRFVSNSANRGGAIHMLEKSTLDAVNCIFDGNNAEDGGGAISNWGKIQLKGSAFSSNSTRELSGGAINNQSEGTVDASNTRFIDNFAENDGGAIFNSGEKNLNLKDCDFNGNEPNDVN